MLSISRETSKNCFLTPTQFFLLLGKIYVQSDYPPAMKMNKPKIKAKYTIESGNFNGTVIYFSIHDHLHYYIVTLIYYI